MKNKKNLYKVFSTSVVATMLTVSFGAGIGQAEETDQPLTEAIEEVVVQESGNTLEASETETANEVDNTETNVTNEEDADQEEVDLLPGDLFYFFKILTEKIKLALANEDIEKAKLLVQFTQDRLIESQELFEEGDEELAYDTLKKALELQDLALDYSDEEKEEDATGSETTKDEEVDSETPIEEVAEEENSSIEEDSESNIDSENVKGELEEAFANNVHGLLIAIQNVKNPTALKALTRNLEKQAEKYEKRYGKLLKAEAEYAKVIAEIKEKVELGQMTEEEAVNKINEEEKELIKKQEEVKSDVQKDIEKATTEDQEENKYNRNNDEDDDDDRDDEDEDRDDDEKRENKYDKKQYKEELKQERKMRQEEFKREKERLKEERKQEHQNEKKWKEQREND